MKYTYLIGNGFDLNIGLKTSFGDFFKKYCQVTSNNNDLIKMFKKEINSNLSLWSDFETQMGIYTKQVVPFGEMSLIEYNFCMEDFRNELVSYLQNEEDRINAYIFRNKCDVVCHRAIEYPFQFMRTGLKKELERYILNFINESIEYNFLIFNYTHTFEEFLCPLGYLVIGDHDSTPRHWTDEDDEESMILDSIGHVIHVHGELGNAILLGVNDEEQIINLKLKDNKDFLYNYIKPTANYMLGDRQDEEAKKIISESDIIFVYGMSLGESDKIWWHQIVEWLSTKEGHREHFLIVFWFDSSLNRNSSLDNIKCQEKIENRLLTFLQNKDSETKKYVKNHIYASLNSNIFKLDFDPFEKSNL